MKFTLRKFRKGDEESLRKNINDKTIAKNTLHIPYPYTKIDAIKWINHNLRLSKSKKPKEANFVIDIDGKVAGCVGLSSIDRQHNNAELGYWLGKEYRGQGIMPSAVKQVLKFGFGKLKLKRIYAFVFVWNTPSARVLQKAGFRFEGIRKKNVKKNTKYLDDMVFAKVN